MRECTQIACTGLGRGLSFPSLLVQRPVQHVHKCHRTSDLLEKSLRSGAGGKGGRQARGSHEAGKQQGQRWVPEGADGITDNSGRITPGLRGFFPLKHLELQARLLLSRPLSLPFRSLEGHRALRQEGL